MSTVFKVTFLLVNTVSQSACLASV